MKTYLSVDLGGTKLLIGQVDENGNILACRRYPTGRLDQLQAYELIKTSIEDYIKTQGWHGEKPVAMGVGLLGRIDNANGIWCQIDPERTSPMKIAEKLSESFDMPCYIDNDVKSATRAELQWGYGKQTRNFIYINVGTGLAAGTVVDGKLVRGAHFNAGEVGHTTVAGLNYGIECVCGRKDCVELYASGSGIDRCARLFANHYNTKLTIPDDERVSVAEVYDLCDAGDELCSLLVDNAATALAGLIMNLARTSDPDTIVLGGGVVSSGYLLEKVNAKLVHSAMRFVTNGVVLTKLNPAYIGLLGAAAVAIN